MDGFLFGLGRLHFMTADISGAHQNNPDKPLECNIERERSKNQTAHVQPMNIKLITKIIAFHIQSSSICIVVPLASIPNHRRL